MPEPKTTPEPKKPDIPKVVPATEPKKPDDPAKADAPKAAPATEPKKPDALAKADAPKATPATEPKKPDAPAKADTPKTAPAGEPKKPDTPAKTDAPKTAPAAEPKKPDGPAKADAPKAAPAAEPKKPDGPAKADAPKAAPAAEPKKPDGPIKADAPKATPVTEPKKPDGPIKADAPKAAPVTEPKKPDGPAKADAPKTAPAPEPKKPDTPAKGPDLKIVPPSTDKPKETPAADPKPKDTAVEPPKGVRITQVLGDRLEKPSTDDLKKLPIPKEGEAFSMRLHPAYFFQFLDHPFSVNREVQDYKELFDSIKENGINEPIKARPREGGGLELISGHRRHDVAMQLNYPVPVVIVQMDDDTAKIEVVDGNLHRQDIPMSELARAAKMKMEALSRKAGRRSKMDQLANGPQKRTDQIVAEDMGMSRNQVQRLVRIDSLIPGLKQQVDDKKLPFNTAVELSYLTPAEQNSVAEYIKSEQTVPSLSQAQELKAKSQEAAKAAKAAPTTGAKMSHNYTSSLPGAEKPTTPAPAAAPTPPEKKAPAPVTEKTIASIMKPKKEPEIKVTFTGDELRSYFGGKQPTVPEAKRTIFEAMDMRKKALEKQAQKQDKTPKAPTR